MYILEIRATDYADDWNVGGVYHSLDLAQHFYAEHTKATWRTVDVGTPPFELRRRAQEARIRFFEPNAIVKPD